MGRMLFHSEQQNQAGDDQSSSTDAEHTGTEAGEESDRQNDQDAHSLDEGLEDHPKGGENEEGTEAESQISGGSLSRKFSPEEGSGHTARRQFTYENPAYLATKDVKGCSREGDKGNNHQGGGMSSMLFQLKQPAEQRNQKNTSTKPQKPGHKTGCCPSQE